MLGLLYYLTIIPICQKTRLGEEELRKYCDSFSSLRWFKEIDASNYLNPITTLPLTLILSQTLTLIPTLTLTETPTRTLTITIAFFVGGVDR